MDAACPLIKRVLLQSGEIAYFPVAFRNGRRHETPAGIQIRSDQMWCAKCQADVSTEVSADGQSIKCTSCGSEVRKTHAPSLHPEIRRARQLIEQLSFDHAEAEKGKPESDADNTSATATTENAPAKPQAVERSPIPRESPQNIRIDGAHRIERGSHAPPPKDTVVASGAEPRQPNRREDQAHATLAAPHFDLSAMPQKRKPGKAESLSGQLLAYAGVLVLTVGTALVLWGQFGGPPKYAPTGWLVATAGQMLLFLGVVTLISGGMQQTTHEVTSRVEYIGNRMLRFEQTAEQVLRGPHFDQEEQRTQRSGRNDGMAAS